MKTKRQVLEQYKQYGSCEGIDCKECPYNKPGKTCNIEHNLIKLGAEVVLDLFIEEEEQTFSL
jgi:hypothetical protein